MRADRRPDRTRWRCAVASILLSCAACELTRPPVFAPFAARNQHPVELTVIDPLPRPATAAAPATTELALAVDWTSLWLQPGTGVDEIRLDGELVRWTPSLRLGVVPGVDIEIALPVMKVSGGVLDGFIEGWHDFFGLPQNKRDEFPRDQLEVHARRVDTQGNLQEAYALDETSLALGDVPIFVGWFPVRAGGLSAGVRAGLELPTGDESRGLGNGELDYYGGLAAGYEVDRLALFAWGGYAFAGTPDTARRAGLEYEDRPSVAAAAEVAVADWVSVLVQVSWQKSVLRQLRDSHATSDQALLWLGGRLRFSPAVALELGVGEDILEDVSPDVTLHAGLRLRL
jgi:hypothetical protein